MKPALSIAVRALAEHVLRGGDLNFTFMGAARPQEGIAGHRRVQSSRPEGYQREVPVACRIETPCFVLTISGRIDGVWATDDTVVVDEIKTTGQDLEVAATAENPVHWGQALIYAHMLAVERGLEAVTVQLTYYHLETGAIYELQRQEDRASLAAFFDTVVGRYLTWAQAVMDAGVARDASIRQLAFPFARYRPGQRDMAVAVYRAARDGRPLLVQAPTGIGKTMAAWFPAVKAVGAGLATRVFYLTARTTGRLVAEDALARLRAAGLRFRVLSLTAKDKICFCPEALCGPDECPYARGHFDRLGDARQAALATQALTRDTVETLSRAHHVCPFAFSLSLAGWVDGIIGDYNYVFDPRVHLRSLLEEAEGGRTLLLVDEAHNLVDRAREMYSAALHKRAVMDARRPVKTAAPALYRALGRINRAMAADRKRCVDQAEARVENAPPEELLARLLRGIRLAEAVLIRHPGVEWRQGLLDLYFAMLTFMRIAEGYDHRYVTFYTPQATDLQVRLFCLDPSPRLGATLAHCAAGVFFSATLSPMDYFAALFGLPAETARCVLPSPFPRHHLAVYAARGISTYFRDRTRTEAAVVETIGTVVNARPGNYLAFFPSYAYLEQIHAAFGRCWPQIATRCQTPQMGEAARDDFLAWLPATPCQARLGFAVMGGVFGEGIDLVGDRLAGAVVVGVGLPAICTEREQIRRHFQDRRGAGFDFAYRFPGINRVLQAAGRVIRSAADRGVVVLIDARYGRDEYRRLLPPHWQLRPVGRIDQLAAALAAFWGRMEAADGPPGDDGI